MNIFFLNLISFTFILYVAFKQYKARSADIVFSILFLFYLVFPLLISIEIHDVGEDTLLTASLITLAFCIGYLMSQLVPIGRRANYLNQIEGLIVKTTLFYKIIFYLLSFYIIIVVVLLDFNRVTSHLYFSNRMQVIYVFSLAILMFTAKNSIDRYKLYFFTILVSTMLFFSGSRIYIVPAVLFILLYKYSFDRIKIHFTYLVSFALVIFLGVSLFRNFEGELFSHRSVVGMLGEFYFTHLSFLLILDKHIYFPHNFYEGVLALFFPFLFPDIVINSDRYVNQFSNFDFGLASSFFNDVALYQQKYIFPYLFIGVFFGLFLKIISMKTSGITYIFSLIFLSFTPILFRSSLFYTFSLIKTLLVYILIITIITIITRILLTDSIKLKNETSQK